MRKMIRRILFIIVIPILFHACKGYSYTKEIPQESREYLCNAADCFIVSERLSKFLIDTMSQIVESGVYSDSDDKKNRNPKLSRNYFIYDLVEVANSAKSSEETVKFKNFHIYHFAHYFHHFSHSHILVLNGSEIKVFSYLNCENKGNEIEDITEYLKSNSLYHYYDNNVHKRLKNYRKYGSYIYHQKSNTRNDNDLPSCI